MITVQTYDSVAAAQGARGHVLGGGTLLMRDVNYTPQDIEKIIVVRDQSMRQITAQGDRLHIGAQVTMAEVIAHPDLQAFAAAARSIGGPALRNMASVGGNLFARNPYGDFATALLAADAQVHWADGRQEPIETMFGTRDTPRGIVTAVSVPRLRADELLFRKVSRTRPKGVSVLSIAAWVQGYGGRIDTARVAFGAMGPTPLRARACEVALSGASRDPGGLDTACARVMDDLAPQDDAIASAYYRTRVAPVHLKRLLLGER